MNQSNLLNETFEKHLKLLHNKLNLNETADDNPLNAIDYNKVNPNEIISIQDFELFIKYAKGFMKMFKWIIPSDWTQLPLDMEQDIAKIKQLSSAKPFDKNAYIKAIAQFKYRWGKVPKP